MMAITSLALFSFLLMQNPGAPQVEVLAMASGVAQPKGQQFEVFLSQLAREEMSIIHRIGNLRVATESLPANWKSVEKLNDQKVRVYHKQDLLEYLSKLELTAAKRWDILLRNLASLQMPKAKMKDDDREIRSDLEKLPEVHSRINNGLDELNSKLKAGILNNLASQIQVSGIE